MANLIKGKIKTKHSNLGIEDLLIVMYDLDPARPNEVGEDNIDSIVRDSIARYWLDFPGDRIGSVLTQKDGSFELSYEDEEFRNSDKELRPDLVLLVLAPDDTILPNNTGTPIPNRLLHYAHIVRGDAGRVENYIIRIDENLLDQFGIPLPGSLKSSSSASELIHKVQQTRNLETAIRNNEAGYVQENVRKGRELSARSKDFVINLSAAPVQLRENPLFIGNAKGVNANVRMATAVTEARNIAQLQLENYKINAQPILRVNLTDNKLEELIRLGHLLTDGDGYIVNSICPLINNNGNGINLQRVRSLADEINSRILPPDDDDDDVVDPPEPDLSPEEQIRRRVLGQIQHLETPQIEKTSKGVMGNLLDMIQEIKSTEQGVADETAFRDFHSLQIALPHIWAEAFDGNLTRRIEELYKNTVQLHEEYGVEMPPLESLMDVNDLRRFQSDLEGGTYFAATPIPEQVAIFFPEIDLTKWNALSSLQQWAIDIYANGTPPHDRIDIEKRRQLGLDIINNPQGKLGRVQRLILEVEQERLKPHAFHYFAPDSYNVALLITHRLELTPDSYQVGDLVSTIPLAPGESRKFSIKRVEKISHSKKEAEKNTSSRQEAFEKKSRAEDEILNRAQVATNFQMTMQGALKFGIGEIGGSSQFSLNQAQESSRIKKQQGEAVMKTASEYRSEHSVEVETNIEQEFESVTSGEIHNTNNELTVTYLFYELERRYKVTQKIHRITPVILIAQDMPAPNEIDEDFLLGRHSILRHVLLDDSLKPAAEYLSNGLAGNELSLEIKKANWVAQKNLVAKLESDVTNLLAIRDKWNESLARLTEGVERARGDEPDDLQRAALGILTGGIFEAFGGLSGEASQSEKMEAARKAMEMRRDNTVQSISDTQAKLSRALEGLNQATTLYTRALEEQTNKRILVEQYKLHVKQYILYYMQAIWAHEYRDQLFFRLYHKPVHLPDRTDLEACRMRPATAAEIGSDSIPGIRREGREFIVECASPLFRPIDTSVAKTFGEVADLDNPLGFKGNYIIFPLKECNYLTDFMMQEYVDDYFGIRDPDEAGNFTTEELLQYAERVREEISDEERIALDRLIADRLSNPRRDTDTIIIPTGQLFIEALTGAHSLLEPFKMLHRGLDAAKVRAEVTEANLDNLRRSSLLFAGVFEDSDIYKKIVLEGPSTGVIVSTET